MPRVTSDPATLPNRWSTKWPTLSERAMKIANPTIVFDNPDHQECHALVVDEAGQRPRRRRFGRQVEFSGPSNNWAGSCTNRPPPSATMKSKLGCDREMFALHHAIASF
jgi:hypothetical protein